MTSTHQPQIGEKDYRSEPLNVRRKALEKLVRGRKLILPARRLSPNGFAAWAEVLVPLCGLLVLVGLRLLE